MLNITKTSSRPATYDDIIESRREPVRRKSPSNSKRDSIKTETITNKSGAIETSVNNNKDKYNIDNNGPVVFPNSKLDIENNNYNNTTGKHINKRQQYSQAKPQKQPNRRNDPVKRIDSCPLCDSSVFSYCSDKLLHDACCCLNPFENSLPYQCQYADCSFLHSNSCREHHLITACCCDRFIYRL
ncbi:uncharacterized protein LOC142324754 isoform X2 [Lycorma delicatula]|uniref:uncharacterized protein LOC142324754 isoform X2 n=1 Tax=Lycorma delicatula TaxID=130591 RepID=UPI003F51AC1D